MIYDNKIVSNQEIFNDLTNDSEWKYLWFASDTYTNYLIDNSYLFSTDVSNFYVISLDCVFY